MNQRFQKTKTVLSTYVERVGAFRPNARFYLISVIISGASLGVYRLLFNFYVLSLGYNEALLGTLITTSSLTALIAALPMGYLVDVIGRKSALIGGTLAVSAAIVAMILWPSAGMFVVMNVLLGLGQSITGVTMGPFLMENSSDKERTYLFSFASGLQTASNSLGNWIGGSLPTWLSAMNLGESATSPAAYGWSLGVIALGGLVAIIPLVVLVTPVFLPVSALPSRRFPTSLRTSICSENGAADSGHVFRRWADHALL